MAQSMITTTDNPFNPFTQFDEWKAFDEDQGYYTCAYLARVSMSSIELSDEEVDAVVEEAIDEIVKLNVLGIYKKVFDTDY